MCISKAMQAWNTIYLTLRYLIYCWLSHYALNNLQLSDIMHWAEDILIQSQDLSDSFCTSASALIRSSPEEYVQHEGSPLVLE